MSKCVFWMKLVIPYKYVYFTFIRRGGHRRANSFHTTKNCIGSFWSKKLHSGPDLQKKLHSEPNLLQWPRSQQRDITLPLPLYYRFFYALSTNFADLFFFFLYMQASIIWSSQTTTIVHQVIFLFQVPENSFLNKQALDCNLNFRLKNGVHVDQELWKTQIPIQNLL